MKKINKGEAGYISAQKKKYLMFTGIEFLIVVAILIMGYIQTGNRKNWFTLIAILGCLPAAKMVVEFITMAPHHGISSKKYAEIEEKSPLLTHVYDNLITSTEKVMPVDAIVLSGNTVCGYTSSEKVEESDITEYLKSLIKSQGLEKITVKIFKEYKPFITRVEAMNSIAAIDKPGSKNTEKVIRRLIMSTSM